MIDPPALGTGSQLQFMAPLSAQRAADLVAGLAVRRPATIVDVGSGWGELLLRLLTALPEAQGVAIDTHGPDLDRGRASAEQRGLADRASFVAGEAGRHAQAADLVISIGAYQAFGTISEALAELRKLVHPGGRLLFGAEFWERPPTEAELGRMWPGIDADACLYLADLVDAAVTAGFRPLRIGTATADEWAEFESGLAADIEEWILDHPDHPETAGLRDKLDAQRSIWLRGHRGVMGFAYLTLGVPAHGEP
ncbi:SAM-dependent methyltransferase [Hamadaea flava]|uniref:Class I SAM-dependent methyltransferase n=1 Tax=Hamadaea flava TaxID=1742688 RepID=A0ABV8M0J2_9ACTN|nr:class I SAM-dependent methyltransferase [Hamadaea flava]MCP2328388.1 SAM-dependent methyltransferase [Hamadaea flava]